MGYPDRCFFTVGKSSSGAWWFIDPKGAKFFSLGVDVVTYSGDSPAGGTSLPHYTFLGISWARAETSF